MNFVCRLRVSEKKVVRRILAPKVEKTGGSRKFHNEELHNFV
jgi:hypothetical protein